MDTLVISFFIFGFFFGIDNFCLKGVLLVVFKQSNQSMTMTIASNRKFTACFALSQWFLYFTGTRMMIRSVYLFTYIKWRFAII